MLWFHITKKQQWERERTKKIMPFLLTVIIVVLHGPFKCKIIHTRSIGTATTAIKNRIQEKSEIFFITHVGFLLFSKLTFTLAQKKKNNKILVLFLSFAERIRKKRFCFATLCSISRKKDNALDEWRKMLLRNNKKKWSRSKSYTTQRVKESIPLRKILFTYGIIYCNFVSLTAAAAFFRSVCVCEKVRETGNGMIYFHVVRFVQQQQKERGKWEKIVFSCHFSLELNQIYQKPLI